MPIFAILSILVTLAALFGFVSTRFLRLPATVGTMLLSLLSAGALLLFPRATAGVHLWAVTLQSGIDFNAVVLHGLLAFLLFAGSLHLDLEQLRREKLAVTLLSLVSTGLATVAVGAGLHTLLALVHEPQPWLTCLLFGALISPTDPVAVLEMLSRTPVPPAMTAQLAGESLFNDGIGAVIFLALLAASTGGGVPTPGRFLGALLVQAGGGILLGFALAYVTYSLLRLVDDYRIEVLLTLALAMGGYALADRLGVSMPLEVITAGLLINGHAREFAMSERTRAHVDQFWGLIDEILNAVLFLLIGLELLAISLPLHRMLLGLAMIPVVLACRWLSVSAVILPLKALRIECESSLALLTWGGLRGGLSVALALSLPQGPARELLISLTYILVISSILVQGLTIGPLLRRLQPAQPDKAPEEAIEAVDGCQILN